MMWEFVSADLIDEYHITHVPRLLGGVTAPTLVQGPGLPPESVVNVKLVSCRRLGSELYLVYRRTGIRGLSRARKSQLAGIAAVEKTTIKTGRRGPADTRGTPRKSPLRRTPKG